MSLYKPHNSQFWYVNISVPGHPRVRRSTGSTDRVEAQRIHDEIKAGLWAAPKLTGKTWGDAVVLWCSAEGRGEPDLLRMRKFASYFKDRLLTDVTGADLTAALEKIAKTPSTYQRYRNCVVAILNGAVEREWLREAPKIPTKKVQAKPRNWLTHEEWERLYRHLPPHQQDMALFAIETGLRKANVLGLTWDRVDLTRKVVWVEGEDTKAGQALVVPLSAEAVKVLQKRVGEHKVFVFTYNSKPITSVRTAFQKACARAELGKHFTWHCLRHTWATWHIQNETPVEVLQKLGGWANLDMVLNYAHHSPGYLARFADNTRKK